MFREEQRQRWRDWLLGVDCQIVSELCIAHINERLQILQIDFKELKAASTHMQLHTQEQFQQLHLLVEDRPTKQFLAHLEKKLKLDTRSILAFALQDIFGEMTSPGSVCLSCGVKSPTTQLLNSQLQDAPLIPDHESVFGGPSPARRSGMSVTPPPSSPTTLETQQLVTRPRPSPPSTRSLQQASRWEHSPRGEPRQMGGHRPHSARSRQRQPFFVERSPKGEDMIGTNGRVYKGHDKLEAPELDNVTGVMLNMFPPALLSPNPHGERSRGNVKHSPGP